MKVFPTALLHFEDHEFDIERRTVTGSAALTGAEDVIETDGGGRWFVEFKAPYLDDPEVALAWNVLSDLLSGGVTPIIVPMTDATGQMMGEVTLPPGGLPWWDETEFAASDPGVTAASDAALRATSLEIEVTFTPQPIRAGQRFSIDHPTLRHRTYRIIEVDGDTIKFRPPLRETVAEGVALDFDDPKCVMRVEGDMRAPRSFGYPEASVRFVEHFAPGYPIGFIDPADFFENYENPYGVELYFTGSEIFRTIPAADARDEWLDGGINARLGGVPYVSISLAKRDDPTRQGTAFDTHYVNYETGADSGPGTSSGAPWKRLTYARANASPGARVIVQQDAVGSDSFAPNGYVQSADISIQFEPQTPGQDKTWVCQMRESVTAAKLAWSSNGDGSWDCDAPDVDVPPGVKASPAMFDLTVLDADGAPLSMIPAASRAASRAAPNSWFRDSTTTPHRLTMHHLNGQMPVPFVTWAYTEVGSALNIQLHDGVTMVIENAAFIRNDGAAASAGVRVQAHNVAVPGPHVARTGTFWAINCAVFGASADGLVLSDIARGGSDYLVVKHCRKDGVNVSTQYGFTNINSGDKTLEGRHIHIWHHGGVCEFLGENGFLSQPALSGSTNASTAHQQCRITRSDVRGGYCDGSTLADVSGAKTWTLNCDPYFPQIAAGGAVPRANYWADGASDAGADTVMSVLYCEGSIDPTGVTFAATNGATIEYARHKGDVSVLAGQTGTVTDVG